MSTPEKDLPAPSLDQSLRPGRWDEYVGQRSIKENLRILLSAAKKRGHPPEHILFYGPPGLGKTTLAHLIAKEISSGLKATSGPAIERVGDLAALLTNLNPGDVLFIDEIHRLNRSIEEILYPAMESGVLDIIIGKGPSARTLALPLPPFTLVAATTRVALLSSPLRSRFSGGTFRLDFYTEGEIGEVLRRSARLLSIPAQEDALREIAARSRFTPRTANYLLKRVRDFAEVETRDVTKETVRAALALLEVDELGLTAADRKILDSLIHKFNGGPVGLTTLSAATGDEQATIAEVVEPYLLQLGLLERTPRGRVATLKAYAHVRVEPPNDLQKRLM